jgi:hypothetical protein
MMTRRRRMTARKRKKTSPWQKRANLCSNGPSQLLQRGDTQINLSSNHHGIPESSHAHTIARLAEKTFPNSNP